VSFQRYFMLAYSCSIAAECMQGPYVYKLFSFYGLSKSEIGTLFVAGYFSSMLFGTIVTGLADRFGRKRLCLVYSLVYIGSFMTKHSTSYYLLLVGRMLAGIATSLLNSVFESWYVAQHKSEGYSEESLIETLSWMSFVKGFVAICTAVASNFVAQKLGFVAPFDIAALFLVMGATITQYRWKENYGDRTANLFSSFSRALVVSAGNPKVWLLGFTQCCFEGAICIFMFTWTPILESTSAGEDLPHGLVVACFMVSIMIGSIVSHRLLLTMSSETVASTSAAISAIALMTSGLYQSHRIVLAAFCIFQGCAGVYFPTIASQRARHIPNEVRSTVMGIFRIPLNLILVLTLLNASQMGIAKLVLFSSFLLGLAFWGEKALGSLGSQSADNAADSSASKETA